MRLIRTRRAPRRTQEPEPEVVVPTEVNEHAREATASAVTVLQHIDEVTS
ncbi:hypothetical protein NOGI109294_10055 [Nocardiopsis gilva]|nr:hypothetical protein [Nocardiopsis gilva]